MELPNLNYIHDLSGGDESFEKKIIQVIKNEFFDESEVYYSNFKLKNYKELSENVHKLKHKISILGLETSYRLAADYENNLREGSTKLSAEFEEILQIMAEYINKL